jgi:hypothetical protein
MNNKQSVLIKVINNEIKKNTETFPAIVVSKNIDNTVNVRLNGMLIPRVRTSGNINIGGCIVTKRGYDYYIV